jgi:acyl carrier protein
LEKQAVLEKIKATIIDKLSVDAQDVTPQASLTQDLGADSLDIVDLIMELETELSIEISDEDAKDLTTVEAVNNYVLNALQKKTCS